MDDWYEREQLHFAAQDGNIDRVTELVDSGVDIDMFDDLERTALHYAVEIEHYQIAHYLIKSGANVNAQNKDKIGETPLSNVADKCSLKMAKFLVKHGAIVEAKGWMGLSAIDRAKNRKKIEGVQVYEYLLGAKKT